MPSDKHYQMFKVTVEALESIVKSISTAPDIRALNEYERQAQQALFNLQHTSMGLAYWVQAEAQARRQAINNGFSVIEPIVAEELKEEEKPKKKTTRRKKNVSKKKD